MSIRSRFQGVPAQTSQENPNLKPLPPQIDPWASRGRFQQVNLGSNPAEERTRVEVIQDDKLSSSHPKSDSDNTTTTKPKIVKEEESITTIIED